MTMYCIAGLSMMHMLLHVESECDIHVITRGRMWRNNTPLQLCIHCIVGSCAWHVSLIVESVCICIVNAQSYVCDGDFDIVSCVRRNIYC